MNYTDLTDYSDDECVSQHVDMRNNHFYSSSYDALQDIDPDSTAILNNRSLQCK